jgi:hypothetical protein
MTIGPQHADAQESAVTAIDIALEPDEAMISKAKAANATLLQNFPKGFSLDATHHPHVSIFAGFVPTADLPRVYAAAGKVLADENYTSWKLTAFKYYYIPLGPIGLGGIVVKPTPDLLRLQQELINAVGPFTVKTACPRGASSLSKKSKRCRTFSISSPGCSRNIPFAFSMGSPAAARHSSRSRWRSNARAESRGLAGRLGARESSMSRPRAALG